MQTEYLEFNAVSVRLPGGRLLFAFPMDGKRIFDIAAVARIRRSDDGNLSGFQREAVKRHIQDIARYVANKDAMIPNAIVVAFDKSVLFQERVSVGAADNGQFGVLRVPMFTDEEKRPGWIVDGQQRTYAIQSAKVDSFPVMVCAFIESDPDVQAEHFVNVNSTKALPRALVSELLPHLAHVPARLTKRSAASLIAQRLAFDDDSPLNGLVRTQTSKRGVIMLNSLIQPLEKLLDEPTGYVGSRVDFDQRLQESDVEDLVREIKAYWSGVKEVFADAWGVKSTQSRLMHGVGMWAMTLLMNRVLDDLRSHITSALVADRLHRIAPLCHWTKDSEDWQDVDGFGRDERWDGFQNTSQDKMRLTRYIARKYREVNSDQV